MRRLRRRRDPVEPAGRRAPRWRARRPRRGRSPRQRAHAPPGRCEPAAARGVGEAVRGGRCAAGRRGAGVVAPEPRRDRAHHRATHGRAARRCDGSARRADSTPTCSPRSTRSSPAPVAPPPRPTPGSSTRHHPKLRQREWYALAADAFRVEGSVVGRSDGNTSSPPKNAAAVAAVAPAKPSAMPRMRWWRRRAATTTRRGRVR